MTIDAIIEIEKGSNLKYEYDDNKKILRLDRILSTSMIFPFNYGFIPNSLSSDGDPLDVILISEYKIMPGTIINTKIIGYLDMEDEKGKDEKLICVPSNNVDKYYNKYTDIDSLEDCTKNKIKHFFKYYKDLENNKWVKIGDFYNKDEAIKLTNKSLLK